jgi:hypothetical protein
MNSDLTDKLQAYLRRITPHVRKEREAGLLLAQCLVSLLECQRNLAEARAERDAALAQLDEETLLYNTYSENI